jgi:hypothetical protein
MTSVGAQHRLVARRREIQDRQATKRQCDVILGEASLIVRTTVGQQVRHTAQQRRVRHFPTQGNNCS